MKRNNGRALCFCTSIFRVHYWARNFSKLRPRKIGRDKKSDLFPDPYEAFLLRENLILSIYIYTYIYTLKYTLKYIYLKLKI